jgi:hypothetical protein
MSAGPEDWNIPWNWDSSLGENDPNNSENIFVLPAFNFQAIMPSFVPHLGDILRWLYVKKFLRKSSKPTP